MVRLGIVGPMDFGINGEIHSLIPLREKALLQSILTRLLCSFAARNGFRVFRGNPNTGRMPQIKFIVAAPLAIRMGSQSAAGSRGLPCATYMSLLWSFQFVASNFANPPSPGPSAFAKGVRKLWRTGRRTRKLRWAGCHSLLC